MSIQFIFWIMSFLFSLHGFNTENILHRKDAKSHRPSTILKSDISKGDKASLNKKPTGTGNRHLREDLDDIDGLIKKLNSVINQLQGANQDQSQSQQKQGCVTDRKRKLKCKKPSQQAASSRVHAGSMEYLESLHKLFSNVSTSFSSIHNKLLQDIVSTLMSEVSESTKSLTQRFEDGILKLTHIVQARLTSLEEQVLRLTPYPSKPQLKGDNPTYPRTQIIIDTPPLLEPHPTKQIIEENSTERQMLNNASLSLSSINVSFTDFMKCYWMCCLPPHNHSEMVYRDRDHTRGTDTKGLTGHYWNEPSSMMGTFQLSHCLYSSGGVSGLVTTALLMLAGVVTAVVLFWSCYRAWTGESDYVPTHINKNRGIYTGSSGLTVVTVSTYKSTHCQVKTIISRLIDSDNQLQHMSKSTTFIEIKNHSAIKDGLLDRYSDSDKVLVFIDVSRDKREFLLEVRDELRERMKALSLENICTALGDTIIIIYGDFASRQLPLGAIYNTAIIDILPLPALRALCRVGRFLTVNNAFTNTQRVLLQHWLQAPANIPCDEDV